MDLIVEWYVLLGDVMLALAIGYVILFMYRRLGKYDPELDILIRYSIVFLVIAEIGRITDIIDDFCCPNTFLNFQWASYFVSIVGIIYSIVHYINVLERKYMPPLSVESKRKKQTRESSLLSGAYVVLSRHRLADVLEIIKTANMPVMAITRFPEAYNELEKTSEVVWVTQLSEGVSPTALHVIQGKVVDFVRRHEDSVVVVDCVEYLLLYNDFRTVVKFLLTLKDYVIASGNTLIVFVDDLILSQQERSLILKEFEVL